MSKHTPGPWEVFDGIILCEKINSYGNWYVAGIQREHTKEDKANLRLISAAPDLLEALKDLLNQIKTCYKEDSEGLLFVSDFDLNLDNANNAIAKAEGKGGEK